MALPAQIGTTTVVARLSQLALGASGVDLANPSTWRVYVEPVTPLLPSLPESGSSTAQLLMPPSTPSSYTLIGGVALIALPIVLHTTGETLAQDWIVTLVQDGPTANDSDDPTPGPFETPQVWGRWLLALTPADVGQQVQLAVRGVPDPTLNVVSTPAWVGLMEAALATYYAAHPAPAGPQGDPGAPGGSGPQGDPGVGVPAGGSAGQVLTKVDGSDYNTAWTAAAGQGGRQDIAFPFSGTLVVASGAFFWYTPAQSIRITRLSITLGVLGTGGGTVTAALLVNGSSVGSVSVAAGTRAASTGSISPAVIPANQLLSVDITQVPSAGTTRPGFGVVQASWEYV